MPTPSLCRVCGASIADGSLPALCPRCASVPGGLEETIRPAAASRSDLEATVSSHAAAAATIASETRPVPAPAGASDGKPFGRYRLLARLGAGGMGVVWKARDVQLDRIVALKLIREEEVGNPTLLERFLREARLAARLRHPNVVPIYDVGEIEGRACLSMELVEGRTLGQRLDETRALLRAGQAADPARLRADVALLAEVAGAVAHAHAAGIVHRDLKPGNVLLDEKGASPRPFVTDFGLAKEVARRGDDPGAGGGGLTTSGEALGTPLYMSPEQASGTGTAIGPATDVWSLGVILYEVLTGRTPFEEVGSPWAVIGAVIDKEPAPPRSCNAHVPPALEAVCLRALHKSPPRRYSEAGAFEAELRRWLAGESVATPPPAPPRPGRRRVLLACLAVVALAGMGTAGWRWSAEWNRTRPLLELREVARHGLEEAWGARTGDGAELAARLTRVLTEAATRARADLAVPSPEPDYHQGRLARCLQDVAVAAEHQDRALTIDPDYAPALYERALLAAREYQRSYDLTREWGVPPAIRLPAGADAPISADPCDDVERTAPDLSRVRLFADALLLRLRRSRSRASGATHADEFTLRVSDAQAASIEAEVAMIQPGGSWEAGRLALEGAYRMDPTLDHPCETLCQEAISRGEAQLMVDMATRGIATHPGNALLWRWRGVAHRMLGDGSRSKGKDPGESYRAALRDFDEAIRLAPGAADPWLDRALVRLNWAAASTTKPDFALELYPRVVADCDESERRDPSVPSCARRGLARMRLAALPGVEAAEARQLLEGAKADLDEAARRAPLDEEIENWREELKKR